MGKCIWSAGKESQCRTAVLMKVSSLFFFWSILSESYGKVRLQRWLAPSCPAPVYNNLNKIFRSCIYFCNQILNLLMPFHLDRQLYRQSCSSQVCLWLECCSYLKGSPTLRLASTGLSFSGSAEHLTYSSECGRIMVVYRSLNVSCL